MQAFRREIVGTGNCGTTTEILSGEHIAQSFLHCSIRGLLMLCEVTSVKVLIKLLTNDTFVSYRHFISMYKALSMFRFSEA